MGKFLDAIGTLASFFQLGKGGAGLRSNSGVVEARNAANNAYANFQCNDASIQALSLSAPLAIANGGTSGNTLLNARSGLGIFASASSSKSSAYTIATTDSGRIIECDATSAAFTITLPSASSASQMTFTIRKVDTSVNAITIACNGSDTIFRAASFILNTYGDSISLASSGSANWVVLGFANAASNGEIGISEPLGMPEGLTLSRNATTPNTQIDIAAGKAIIDRSAKRYLATSASTFTKRLDATWATGTGNGGRFSGTVSANQWWHVFAMRNDVTAAIDFGFDTSVTGANKPSGWSVRRIGSIKTDGSSNIIDFIQVGNNFYWKTEPVDVRAAIGTSATLYTISVPLGLSVEAIVRLASGLPTSGNACSILISSPLINDQAPGQQGNGPASTESAYVAGSIEFEASTVDQILTNTSSQIRARATFGSYLSNPRIAAIGWIDPRGGY